MLTARASVLERGYREYGAFIAWIPSGFFELYEKCVMVACCY